MFEGFRNKDVVPTVLITECVFLFVFPRRADATSFHEVPLRSFCA